MAQLEMFLHITDGDRGHTWVNPDTITKITALYDSRNGPISSLDLSIVGSQEEITVRDTAEILNILRQVGTKDMPAKDVPKHPKKP